MQSVIDFILGHQALVAGAVVAIIDLAMALVPSLSGNGILHQIYLWLKSVANKPSAPSGS